MRPFRRLVPDGGEASTKPGRTNRGVRQTLRCHKQFRTLVAVLAILIAGASAWSASYYSQRLEDPKAVYVESPSGSDDTVLLQQAVDRVQGQGIVLLGPGRYHITNTIYIWPSIRVIGWGMTRPVIVLPANTPGFGNRSDEKVMFFFAGGRRGRGGGQGSVSDANPGTFYSALANVDIEIEAGNVGAAGIRAHYAQHCFLAHMDFHLGPAVAGIHEAGNIVEDLHFYGGRHAIWTGKPSPSWQFTAVDCWFEGQSEASILEHEAGLTLIRPRFLRVPTAVSLDQDEADELWLKDPRFEDISGPALSFGLENNPRNEINLEGAVCRNVPVFAELRDSGKRLNAPGPLYTVKTFSHGLRYTDLGVVPQIETVFEAAPAKTLPPATASDIPALPPVDSWVNLRTLGAKGDGAADDTEIIQKAIAEHRTIYLPCGFYVVRDTLRLRPDTVLIGLHPGATQIILPDGTSGYQGAGEPKALLEAPKGGSNVVIGVGLYTSGINGRAVAALWKAGANSMMNDVRFLGGHGTPKPDGGRENPYNRDHSGDSNPSRRWNSQYPSLWVTDGGGGTFMDIWTPSTFAKAGMLISDTETEGRIYEMSSEHHVKNEVQLHNAAHWRIYALQTEEERGESGLALPLEIDSCHDITVANFHIYRVISSFQPFPYAIKVSNSHDLRFRNLHCYSNSKVSFDATVFEQSHKLEIRQHELAWLDISGRTPPAKVPAPSPVAANGARVEKLAGGFFNIFGGAVGPQGDFFFVDAQSNRIYRWTVSSRKLSTVSERPLSPVNLLADKAGNLLIVSSAGNGTVYALAPNGDVSPLKQDSVTARPAASLFLPVSDWRLNRDSLSRPAAHFVSPDGGTVLPVGADFLRGATSWGVKSSPPIRSFGLARAVPGQPFYVSDEAAISTWAADVETDGNLRNFRLFANQGGEGVAVDSQGHVYLAAGQIYVYDRDGKLLDTIEVPERPVQLAFGGKEGKTLFIAARSALYSLSMRYQGR